MAAERPFDPDLEWIDHVQPVGLVVAGPVLKERQLVPTRQTEADTAAVAALIDLERERPALADPWPFFAEILGWRPADVAGAPGGQPLPESLAVHLHDQATVLRPDWAVRAPQGEDGWQLLVKREPPGLDPDRRGAAEGWEATAHQRFERLLRDSGVHTGILISDHELRLVHAPKAETSGWLSFPLRALTGVAGRIMLGGLKLLLSTFRLHNDAAERRLPAVLKASREAQASVSTKLAEQVLGALHELLRSLDRADPALIRALAQDRPAHLYEGLLTVLLRLVFLLYAEDRDLIPSRNDGPGRSLYQANYAVRGLFAKLEEDAALNPDTMDERQGAWGRLLATFRLVHGGDRSGWVKARGGKLFDPDLFGFLEGRTSAASAPIVPKLSDGCVHRVLRGLLTIAGEGGIRERLSYRTLDVQEIGSVYEIVMGFTVEVAAGRSLAIKAGKANKTPVFVDLDALASKKPAERLNHLKEEANRGAIGAKTEKAIKEARTPDDLAAALDGIADERGAPGRHPVLAGTPILQPTAERRRTGSHYTPRILTEPIVRHALEPAMERLGPDATPELVLDTKLCDPAMGSGAFLVEACRALAARLVQAWERWPRSRPTLPQDEDDELHARRLVAQRCLYGVDKNPMAVDLARLSLWLATLARDHEFSFLDHALKAGDSLVGLTLEQMARLAWSDDRDASQGGAALPLLQPLVRNRFAEALEGRAAIREAPDDVASAIQETRFRAVERRLDDARALGDAVVAAFFAADKAKVREAERSAVESAFQASPPDWAEVQRRARGLRQGPHPLLPFHWELEFPEVFARVHPGFDTIVGNPPFAGKNTITESSGPIYLDWLKTIHAGAHGSSDLVAHFFRRCFALLRNGGRFGLIATKTIRQGDTRDTGLAPILASGGAIARAVRRIKWAGDAAVVVAVVHVQRGPVASPVLDDRPVRRISAYLVEGDLDASPETLAANAGLAFQGQIILGDGFTFDDAKAAKGTATSLAEMRRLIEADPRNAERIKPYIGGEEVNNNPRQQHHRYVIDFADFPLERRELGKPWSRMNERERKRCLAEGVVPSDYPDPVAADWPELLAIVERLVRPQRMKDKREPRRRRWWRFAEIAAGLRAALTDQESCYSVSRVSNHLGFVRLPSDQVLSDRLVSIVTSNIGIFSVIQSRVHEVWVRNFSSTLKDDLNYSNSDCFDTFPFPADWERDMRLAAVGEAYHAHRADLMIMRAEGLTRIYNRFHAEADKAADIQRLRELHAALDEAVLRAYGWDDLAGQADARFLGEDDEDDHTYQGRLFWPSEFRDEVLARLLALNAERHREEVARGVARGASRRAVAESRDGGDLFADEDEG